MLPRHRGRISRRPGSRAPSNRAAQPPRKSSPRLTPAVLSRRLWPAKAGIPAGSNADREPDSSDMMTDVGAARRLIALGSAGQALRTLVIAAGVGASVLFVVVGLRYGL